MTRHKRGASLVQVPADWTEITDDFDRRTGHRTFRSPDGHGITLSCHVELVEGITEPRAIR